MNVGDQVHHIDSEDNVEEQNCLVVHVRDDGLVDLVGPGAMGVGTQYISGATPADFTPATSGVRADVAEIDSLHEALLHRWCEVYHDRGGLVRLTPEQEITLSDAPDLINLEFQGGVLVDTDSNAALNEAGEWEPDELPYAPPTQAAYDPQTIWEEEGGR